MEDNKFFITLWKYLLIALCVLILTGVTSCQSSKYQLRKMTESTGSAIESSCAMQMISDGGISGAGTALICAQYQIK